MKLTHLLALVGLGAVAVVGFDQSRTRSSGPPAAAAVQAAQARAPAGDPPWGAATAAPAAAGLPAAASATFRCDGRTHCSQMTSCAEAEYFLRNCPGTKMDGNRDGVPCERQWCR